MKILSITGGKGGCGKTTVSANLGIALAQMGQRVTIFDADLGLANLDILLGVHAEQTLQDVLAGEASLTQIVSDGPAGVKFIAGGSGVRSLLTVGPKKLKVFLSQVPELAETTDILIFDTGAGVDPKVTSFLRASDASVLVTTPDPACVIDAYATAKTLYRYQPDADVRVVVNMCWNESEARRVFDKLQETLGTFLDKEATFNGCIRAHQQVQQCTRKRVPYITACPALTSSEDIRKVAVSLCRSLPESRSCNLETHFAEAFRPAKVA